MKPEETESEGGGDENRWRLMKRQKRRDMEETEGKGFRHMEGEMERDLLPCLPAVWFPITKWKESEQQRTACFHIQHAAGLQEEVRGTVTFASTGQGLSAGSGVEPG